MGQKEQQPPHSVTRIVSTSLHRDLLNPLISEVLGDSSTNQGTMGTKRPRSSSLIDQIQHQGDEEKGRARVSAPARRRRVELDAEDSARNRATGSPPAEKMRVRQASPDPSPWAYDSGEEGPGLEPEYWGGRNDDIPRRQQRSHSPDSGLHRDEGASRRYLDDRVSTGREEWGRQGSPQQRDWNARQGKDGSPRQRPIETLGNDPQPPRDAGQISILHDHRPTHIIENARNVFVGTNYGHVFLGPVRFEDEFMLNLPDRLKICVQADHKYYASGEDITLHRGQCTPGTRIDTLQGIMLWATDMSSSSAGVYWLLGQAGAGKTTIAYTIACQLQNPVSNSQGTAILGASFFCSRQFLDTKSATSIVRTIVHQLALRSKSFQTALKKYGRFETVNHGTQSQFIGLLAEPWKESASERLAEEEPCYVISIDALDELEGTGGTEFLGTLFDVVETQDLSGIKFFVTSRSQPMLVKRMEAFSSKQVCRLDEVPLEESSADIRLYLNLNLGECATPEQIQQLVSITGGLFIYAVMVVDYVKGRGIEEQRSLFKRLLTICDATAFDNLYLAILETSLVDPRDHGNRNVFQDCLSILHTFLCTVERASVAIAVDLLNASCGNGGAMVDAGIANGVLHRLHAVLYNQGGQVMWYHKSFADFLFDKGRSQQFFCDRDQHHRRLANGCFRIMAEQLRFNIAEIPTSYWLDCDNPALPASVEANVSKPLRYACGSWSAHLTLTSIDACDHFAEAVNEFLPLQILLWMEAMNLLGQRGCCQRMLRDTRQWFSEFKGSAELLSNLADAAAFAAYHSTSVAALSLPHLYLSSLATFPRQSAVTQNWRRHLGGIPRFISAHRVGGESLVASISVGHWVKALALSPDGVNVAVGSPDGFVQIWDLSTGEEAKVLKGHSKRVTAVAYSPNGSHLASGSLDALVRVWDLVTGEDVRVLKGCGSGINAVAYSPSGNHLVAGSQDEFVRVWDLSTEEETRIKVFKGHTHSILSVAFSPDGAHALSGSADKSIRVWDVSTGQEVKVLKGHTGTVHAVAYSPNATHVVSGSQDGSVRVWALSTGEEVKVLKGHTDSVNGVAYSPDGTHVISGSGDTFLRVWNLSSAEVRILKGHSLWVQAVAYLPDGVHVVSGSEDKSIRVWDLSTGEGIIRPLGGHTNAVQVIAYSPDGAMAVSGSSDCSVRVWDLLMGEEAKVVKGHSDCVQAVAYSPDGTHIASGSDDESVRVWDLSTGEEAWILEGCSGRINAVAYSPSGTYVAAGSQDETVRVWDLSIGEEVWALKGHVGMVCGVAFSPDENHIVSASSDDSVRVWDLATGKEVKVLRGHDYRVKAVAYSPDGTLVVSGAYDRSVRVWDLSTAEEIRLLEGHTDWVQGVSYSPDGTNVASCSEDKTIRVWDLSTGKELRVLHGHTDPVNAVAHSPDGTHAISGSSDTSVRVWNISPNHTPRYVREKASDERYTGWLLSPTDPLARLMFVRPEALLPDDTNVLTLPSSAVSHVDFSGAKLGDNWAECFTPASL